MFKKLIAISILAFVMPVFASDVKIVHVVLTENSESWRADVTLKHDDTGWKHYADGWRVVDAKGNELGNRVLYHPHVNEQPFTRSLGSFYIPKNINVVYVEAHDFKRGWSPHKVKINLNKNRGDNYQVKR